MQIVHSLAPVFLIIALGAVLHWRGFLCGATLAGLSKLTYWVGLPAWLFYRTSQIDLVRSLSGGLLAMVFFGTVVALVAGVVTARLSRMPTPSRGAYLQACFRGNLAYIGIPVMVYAFADLARPDYEIIQNSAIVAFIPLIIFYNVASVVLLLKGRQDDGTDPGRSAWRPLLTNPLILACLLGGVFSLLNIPLLLGIERTLEAVGQIALPSALLCVGGSLVVSPVRKNLSGAVGASLIKVLVAPLGGWVAATALGLDPHLAAAGMILLACPTAAASFVLAEQLRGDVALASSAILVSTLLSIGTFSLLLLLFF